MGMDQHFFRESWKDVRGYGGMHDMGYLAAGLGSGPSSPSVSSQTNGQVDKDLYRDLVEMVPLVQSLMDYRVNKSFSHYSTLVYTPTPTPRDLSARKMQDQNARKTPQTTRGTKQRAPKEGLLSDNCKNNNVEYQGQFPDEVSIFSSRSSVGHEENMVDGNKAETLSSGNSAELLQLQNQIEVLEKKLVEKEDELLKSAENSAIKMEATQMKLEELQWQIQEKDSLIKAAHLQLCHKKNELADVKSLLKKAEEDSKASKGKLQKLEEDLNGLRCQIAAFISFFQTAEDKTATSGMHGVQSPEDLDVDPDFSSQASHLNSSYMVDLQDEIEHDHHMASTQSDKKEEEDLEQARRMYLAAIIAAKNNPGEESLCLAAGLRVQLQQFLLRPTLENTLNDKLSIQALSFPAS